jgi:hypothetical protein
MVTTGTRTAHRRAASQSKHVVLSTWLSNPKHRPPQAPLLQQWIALSPSCSGVQPDGSHAAYVLANGTRMRGEHVSGLDRRCIWDGQDGVSGLARKGKDKILRGRTVGGRRRPLHWFCCCCRPHLHLVTSSFLQSPSADGQSCTWHFSGHGSSQATIDFGPTLHVPTCVHVPVQATRSSTDPRTKIK